MHLSKKTALFSNQCEGDESNCDVPKPNEKVSIGRAKWCIYIIRKSGQLSHRPISPQLEYGVSGSATAVVRRPSRVTELASAMAAERMATRLCRVAVVSSPLGSVHVEWTCTISGPSRLHVRRSRAPVWLCRACRRRGGRQRSPRQFGSPVAGGHISELYVAHCHALPASQSACA